MRVFRFAKVTGSVMSLKKKVVFRIVAVVMALLFCEVLLSCAVLAFPKLSFYLRPGWGRQVLHPDPDFGHRMDATYPGNDRRGFRNPAALPTCDILAIGDSMTYGFAAPADKCWPREVERLLGKSVYNMSCGDYSPCEYLLLLEQGLELSPKTIVVCLYLGNDLANAYRTVHVHHRLQEFNNADEATLWAMAEAEKQSSFEKAHQRNNLSPAASRDGNSIRGFVSNNSSLFGAVRFAKNKLLQQHFMPLGEDSDRRSLDAFRDVPNIVIFEDQPELATAFVDPDYYGMAMDLDDPRIMEGWKITKAVLAAAKRKSDDCNARLLVAFVPTKHAVYVDLVRGSESATIPESYFELVAMEERLRSEAKAFLCSADIAFVDTIEPLRDCLRLSQRPYPPNTNTHPNATGYAAIARGIANVIE